MLGVVDFLGASCAAFPLRDFRAGCLFCWPGSLDQGRTVSPAATLATAQPRLKRAGNRIAKYRNVKTAVGEIQFDSKAEARRYGELALMAKAGVIEALELQRSFELVPAVKFEGSKRQTPALRYIADFAYTEWIAGKKTRVVEDVKGVQTQAFKIKRHLMKSLFGIDIRITK